MSAAEIIDADVLDDESNVAALVPVQERGSSLVTPAADLEHIVAAFTAYQALRERLLTDDDYQTISGKRFPKKSAWRKLAVAFGVTFTIIDRRIDRDGRDVTTAEFVVRATAPNGRYAEGWGACDLYEKCCPPGCRRSHRHCATDCPGTVHYSHANHDIPATAETRAKNRAASDLFGMGEVSAEEMAGDTPPQTPAPTTVVYATEPGSITDEQRGRLFVLFREHGIGEARRRAIQQRAYKVEHLTDLSERAAANWVHALSDGERRAAMLALVADVEDEEGTDGSVGGDLGRGAGTAAVPPPTVPSEPPYAEPKVTWHQWAEHFIKSGAGTSTLWATRWKQAHAKARGNGLDVGQRPDADATKASGGPSDWPEFAEVLAGVLGVDGLPGRDPA